MSAKLLPKTVGEFASDAYWKKFFVEYEQSQKNSFEWYGTYQDLQRCLEKYLKITDKILQLGCGNSTLADQLYDNGFRSVTSVDIVPDVIKKQKQRNKRKRPKLTFDVCDVTNHLPYADSSFNVVLDKGTLDALLSEHAEENLPKIKCTFENILRVLANGGRYITVSLAQETVLRPWISYFNGRCLLRLHQVDMEDKSANKQAVFLLIATKLKDNIRVPEVYEYVSTFFSTPKRYSDVDELIQAVGGARQFSYFCHKASSVSLDEELKIQLYDQQSEEPVYNVTVVPKLKHSTGGCPYGVFVVPKGNEKGYFFSTPAGRQELCNMANIRRLAVVSQCGPTPKTLDDVKHDLDGVVLNFAPSSMRDTDKNRVPYLSIGGAGFAAADQDVDESPHVLETYTSDISGEFKVVEVACKDEVFALPTDCRRLRQLIFSSNLSLIQSEIKVEKSGQLDWSNLACLHHRAIVASLAIANTDFMKAPMKICLVGLGGGCLAMFLRMHFPNASITVLEIDPVVVEAAEKWFEFRQDDHLTCIVGDGVRFFDTAESESVLSVVYDVIVFDVSGSDTFEGGLTCPPPAFLTEQCLKNVRASLKSAGALALNLAVRCKEQSRQIKRRIQTIFDTVLSHAISEDTINELLICLPYKPSDSAELTASLHDRLTKLHEYLADICKHNSVTPPLQSQNVTANEKKDTKFSTVDCLTTDFKDL